MLPVINTAETALTVGGVKNSDGIVRGVREIMLSTILWKLSHVLVSGPLPVVRLWDAHVKPNCPPLMKLLMNVVLRALFPLFVVVFVKVVTAPVVGLKFWKFWNMSLTVTVVGLVNDVVYYIIPISIVFVIVSFKNMLYTEHENYFVFLYVADA